MTIVRTSLIVSLCAAAGCSGTQPTKAPYQGIWFYSGAGTTDLQCPQLDQPPVDVEEPEYVVGNMIRTSGEYKMYTDIVVLDDEKKDTVKEAEKPFFDEEEIDEESRVVFQLSEDGYQDVSFVTIEIDPEEHAVLDVPISVTVQTVTTYHFTSETKGEITTETTYDCVGPECQSLMAEYDIFQEYLRYPTLPCTDTITQQIEKAYASEEIDGSEEDEEGDSDTPREDDEPGDIPGDTADTDDGDDAPTPATPISSVRLNGNEGALYTVSGVVTQVRPFGFNIQDSTSSNSGLLIYVGTDNMHTPLEVGDLVSVTGIYELYLGGRPELNLSNDPNASYQVVGSGVAQAVNFNSVSYTNLDAYTEMRVRLPSGTSLYDEFGVPHHFVLPNDDIVHPSYATWGPDHTEFDEAYPVGQEFNNLEGILFRGEVNMLIQVDPTLFPLISDL